MSIFFEPYDYESGPSARAQDEAHDAARKAQQAVTDVEFMKRDIDRLHHICEAFWMILQHEHGYQDEDLKKMVAEIGLRKSQVEKKMIACPQCNRPVSVRQPKCMYCESPLEHDPFAH